MLVAVVAATLSWLSTHDVPGAVLVGCGAGVGTPALVERMRGGR